MIAAYAGIIAMYTKCMLTKIPLFHIGDEDYLTCVQSGVSK